MSNRRRKHILKPGTKIGDLLRRNMTQPYVLQRLAERTGRANSEKPFAYLLSAATSRSISGMRGILSDLTWWPLLVVGREAC